jgi:N6-L-threonylcarbamoyladenine synthase
MRLVLGIESSCDETAAAVVEAGCRVRASIIHSQTITHQPFGGVVPELASREHLQKIVAVVAAAMEKAAVTWDDIDAIAVTYGPGLVGALLVGICYAKSLAYSLNKPLIGVNHLEGHIYSVVFENPMVQYPALALVVSGGHTSIYLMPAAEQYQLIGHTRDDAAGEAFDKVAKLLNLGYPGGPIIDRLAQDGDPDAARLVFTLPRIDDGRFDFSFSGLKTAVRRYVQENSLPAVVAGEEIPLAIKNLAASFQQAAVKTLTQQLFRVVAAYHPRTILLAGGVACNSWLRKMVTEKAASYGIPVYYPSPPLTTDNAAMIAAAGYPKLQRGERATMELTAVATLRLQNLDAPSNAAKIATGGKTRYRLG